MQAFTNWKRDLRFNWTGEKWREYTLCTYYTFLGGKKLLFPIPSITKKDVIFLKELVQKGEYNPVIDRQYKLDQIVEAYKYVESGQKTGNVILKIVEWSNQHPIKLQPCIYSH